MATTLSAPSSRRGLRQMFGAFFRIDVVEEFSYPFSFFMSELGIVLPVVASYFIGQLTIGSDNQAFFGTDYFTFAVLGLAVTDVMRTSLSGFGFALQSAQQKGILETFLVEPIPWTMLPIAMNTWRVVLSLFNGALVLLLGWALGANFVWSGLPMFVLFLLLGILASQTVGILSASFLVLSKKSNVIVRLYSMAATILAGAVFSVDQLPAWLRAFSWLLPHTYVITAAREQMMVDSGSFTIPTNVAITVLSIFIIVVGGLGVYLFRRALLYARKLGVLSGY